MSNLSELSISGRVVQPSDADWDDARLAWNLVVDQRPAAVALVQSADDVAAAVRFAAAHQLRVTAQGTGHGAPSLGSLEDTLLIKTGAMRSVEVDRDARTARLQAGVLSGELGAAAQAAGLSALPGFSSTVGVVGYTLGGGLGWLGRRYGFACNRVSAIELVTAAGEQRTVDAETDSDLFWALRGGGGNDAVVTALQIELVPISELYAGALIFPAELGAEAIRAYRDWAAGVTEEVTSTVRFLNLPPLPEVPEPLRGRALLTVGAAVIGNQADGERVIAPLREIGEPIVDTFAQIPAAGLTQINMDPDGPAPGVANHDLIDSLPDAAIDAFVGVAGPQAEPSLLLSTELRQLGGALGRDSQHAGALAKLDAAFVVNAVGVPSAPEQGAAIDADLDRLHDAIAPWRSDGGYINFADRPCDLDAIFAPDVCERLREVGRRWDPDGLIRGNHMLAVGA
ncbi:MAG TPA: FAD-binding protein [Solirubrobacteraceae bacterium]|jgi:FAD/FMN-containing dehydrogenase|nr:FAD-binding protein [Solirubrobacteraceae bacterium]